MAVDPDGTFAKRERLTSFGGVETATELLSKHASCRLNTGATPRCMNSLAARYPRQSHAIPGIVSPQFQAFLPYRKVESKVGKNGRRQQRRGEQSRRERDHYDRLKVRRAGLC